MQLGRPGTGRTKAVSFQVNPTIIAKIKEIIANTEGNPSFNEAMERIFIDVINAGKLPAFSKLPDEFEEVTAIESEARIQRLEKQLREMQELLSAQIPERFTQLPPEPQKHSGKPSQTVAKKS